MEHVETNKPGRYTVLWVCFNWSSDVMRMFLAGDSRVEVMVLLPTSKLIGNLCS